MRAAGRITGMEGGAEKWTYLVETGGYAKFVLGDGKVLAIAKPAFHDQRSWTTLPFTNSRGWLRWLRTIM